MGKEPQTKFYIVKYEAVHIDKMLSHTLTCGGEYIFLILNKSWVLIVKGNKILRQVIFFVVVVPLMSFDLVLCSFVLTE